jgi:Fur family transcriptional regulator, peroxide stress response regulator
MPVPAPEIESRLNQLLAAFRTSGRKLTPQRLEVFRALAGTDEHPDAEAIHARLRKRLPTVSLDTVYRALWLLRDLGLVSTLGPPWGRVRFDANRRPHHHFICTRCGSTQDFVSGDFDVLPAPEQAKARRSTWSCEGFASAAREPRPRSRPGRNGDRNRQLATKSQEARVCARRIRREIWWRLDGPVCIRPATNT